jgi:hypothetical protein
MRKHYTKAEKEAYQTEQAGIKEAWKRFDAFMSGHGWTKFHLFMRGTKWVKGNDTIIYDRKGWQLNGQTMTEQEIHTFLHYD